MPKRNIEEELEQLSALRTEPAGIESAAALEKALRDKVNLIVARAAKISAELNISSSIPSIAAAFERLMIDPVKSDPQCWGKNSLAKALKDLGHRDSAIFVRGIRHVQMEPVWGGEADTASVLRGTCAVALAECLDVAVEEILACLVDALADPAAPVRQDAARAIAQLGSSASILLLRLKARLGDEDPAVTGDILGILLDLENTAAVEFAASFLDHSDEAVRDEAALALGASRLEPAIAILQARWNKPHTAAGSEILTRALAASRLESALNFLCWIIRSGRRVEALPALQALQLHRHSERVHAEIAAAVSDRADEELQSWFDREFPVPQPE